MEGSLALEAYNRSVTQEIPHSDRIPWFMAMFAGVGPN
jgi:hypothetical protein